MPPATSFRDPGGVCLRSNDRIFRFVRSSAVANLHQFLNSPSAARLIAERRLIPTESLSKADAASLCAEGVLPGEFVLKQQGELFEHERILFPSYPYEWPPEMLHAAALLTLDIVEAATADGFTLKDATPLNILFRGAEPVFVDVLSFEPRDVQNPLWNAYAQFVRTFLLPLLVSGIFGTRLSDIFLTHRDGLEPDEVYRMCGIFRRLLPPVLNLVTLPVWLSSKSREGSFYQKRAGAGAEKARFILQMLFRRLRRTVRKLEPNPDRNSVWTRYTQTHNYTEQALAAKERFVTGMLQQFGAKRVLDVGANTGHFSLLAATHGATVVAVDTDSTCIGTLWKEAAKRKLDVLPLVVDVSRPSPAVGWRNSEGLSFLERACGSFDCVLMLALVHHLLVTERIPLKEIFDLPAQFTTDLLIIEYVPPNDPMFLTLCRGRESLFSTLTREVFEKSAQAHFVPVNSLQLPASDRYLYAMRKRAA